MRQPPLHKCFGQHPICVFFCTLAMCFVVRIRRRLRWASLDGQGGGSRDEPSRFPGTPGNQRASWTEVSNPAVLASLTKLLAALRAHMGWFEMQLDFHQQSAPGTKAKGISWPFQLEAGGRVGRRQGAQIFPNGSAETACTRAATATRLTVHPVLLHCVAVCLILRVSDECDRDSPRWISNGKRKRRHQSACAQTPRQEPP